jgi:hypothetical protein
MRFFASDIILVHLEYQSHKICSAVFSFSLHISQAELSSSPS